MTSSTRNTVSSLPKPFRFQSPVSGLNELWQEQTLLPLVRYLGQIAMHYFPDPEISVKSDKSIVTNADRLIEAELDRLFTDEDKNCFVLGEETQSQRDQSYLKKSLKGQTLIVDPIDGTAPFASKLPLWGISVGAAKDGALVDGFVYMPVLKELFISFSKKVYYFSELDLHDESMWSLDNANIIDPSHVQADSDGLVCITQTIAKKKQLDIDNIITCFSCAVLPLTYMLLGRISAYITQLRIWDMAGSLPLLMHCGALPKFTDGSVLTNKLNEENYLLDFDQPKKLWKTREQVIYTFSDDLHHKILNGLNLKPQTKTENK